MKGVYRQSTSKVPQFLITIDDKELETEAQYLIDGLLHAGKYESPHSST
jgi:hypothetical protein